MPDVRSPKRFLSLSSVRHAQQSPIHSQAYSASSPIASFAGARARSALGELPSALPLPQRKLAAILAADVEGYSSLMHANEEAALTTLSSP